MTGRRRADGTDPVDFEVGDYGRYRGTWYGRAPNGLFCNLFRHDVAAHEDGTVTAAPSILVRQRSVGEWHGYLERGVWRSA